MTRNNTLQENGEWLKQYVKVERLGLEHSWSVLNSRKEGKDTCTDPCLKIFKALESFVLLSGYVA